MHHNTSSLERFETSSFINPEIKHCGLGVGLVFGTKLRFFGMDFSLQGPVQTTQPTMTALWFSIGAEYKRWEHWTGLVVWHNQRTVMWRLGHTTTWWTCTKGLVLCSQSYKDYGLTVVWFCQPVHLQFIGVWILELWPKTFDHGVGPLATKIQSVHPWVQVYQIWRDSLETLVRCLVYKDGMDEQPKGITGRHQNFQNFSSAWKQQLWLFQVFHDCTDAAQQRKWEICMLLSVTNVSRSPSAAFLSSQFVK